MTRWWVRAVLVAGLIALVGGGAVAWRLRPRTSIFLTDGETIREPVGAASVREVVWQPPVRLDQQVNLPADVYEPCVSRDGLTLYFVRGRAGKNAELFSCRRTLDGWTPPTPLEGVNSEHDELGPHTSPDDRVLYFYSDRPGGLGGYDLWVTRRDGEGWASPENLGPTVNSEFNEYGVAVSPDAKWLYFSSNRPRGDEPRPSNAGRWPATLREELIHHDYDLYRAAIEGESVTPATPLTALNTPANEGSPCVSPFGDFLYFSSDRSGGMGGFDLYRARLSAGRIDVASNLGSEVNTRANELDPALSIGGYGLYFSSDRAAGGRVDSTPADYQLYQTSSREVFRDVVVVRPVIDWSMLWRRLAPNLMWALLALLAMFLLLWGLRDLRRRKLSLLTKCLLLSLFVHFMLMLLFNVWSVGTTIANEIGRGGPIQVALTGPSTGELAGQVRGALTRIDAPTPDVPPVEVTRPQIALPAMPSMTETEAPRTAIEVATLVSRQPSVSDAPTAPPRTKPVASSFDAPAAIEQLVIQTPGVATPVSHSEAAMSVPSIESPIAVRIQDMPFPTSQAVERVNLAPGKGSSARAASSIASPSMPVDANPRGQFSTPIAAAAGDTGFSSLPELALPQSAEPSDSGESEVPKGVAAVSGGAPHARGSPSFAPPRIAQLDGPRANVTGSAERSFARPDASDAPVSRVQMSSSTGRGAPDAVGFGLAALPGLALPPEVARSSTGTAEGTGQVVAPVGGASHARAGVPVPRSRAAVLDGPRAETVGPAGASLVRPRASDAPVANANASTSIGRGVPEPSGYDPLGLAIRIPTEEKPPENPYLQRAPEQRQDLVKQMGGSDRTEAAVNKALKWLAAHQSKGGQWSSTDFDANCGECSGAAQLQADVAMTGLAVLCFLGADHTHVKDGPYRENVRRGLRWLRRRQQPDGDLRHDESMYSQGIATIALAEAYGMTRDDALAEPVRRASEFIWEARNRRGAGWRYEPGQFGDTSVLGWQIMALRSAQRAGVDVPEAAFETAQRWLDMVTSRSRPGLYAYQPGRAATASMTAEGMFVLQLTGVPSTDARMDRAAALLMRNRPDWDGGANTYYWYYATLSLFQRQGGDWPKWNRRLIRELLAHQETDGAAAGSWSPEGEWAPAAGRVYQTALCTLMLEVYYRYLPMYSGGHATTQAAANN